MINIDHNPVETEDGVWTHFGGSKLLITHVSNMAFQRKLARLQQPYAKKITNGTLSPDIQKDILCEAMAGTILKDGEFVDRDNKPVAFTAALAKQVLMNQIEVREFVTEFSGNLENYRKEEADELGKTS